MSLPAETRYPKAIIGVSLKMYFGHKRTLAYCLDVAEVAAAHPAVQSGDVELFVLPSHTALAECSGVLEVAGVSTGAQDIFWEDDGPFTGEVSGAVVAEVGGRYAEVGHAERRRIFGEDDDVVALKTAAAYRNGLTPVLCVGEPTHRTASSAIEHCVREIDTILDRAESIGHSGRTIIAYEPHWAIGATIPATPDFISEVTRGIDSHIRGRRGQGDSRVIYGGSAGPGLISQLDSSVAGLFLGRFAHDPVALRSILDETAHRLASPEVAS